MSVSRKLLEELRGDKPWRVGLDESALAKSAPAPPDHVVVDCRGGQSRMGASQNSVTDLRRLVENRFSGHTEIIRTGARELLEGLVSRPQEGHWYGDGGGWFFWCTKVSGGTALGVASSGGMRTGAPYPGKDSSYEKVALDIPVRPPMKELRAKDVPDKIRLMVAKGARKYNMPQPTTPGPQLSKEEIEALKAVRYAGGNGTAWNPGTGGWVDGKETSEQVLKSLASKGLISLRGKGIQTDMTREGKSLLRQLADIGD